MRLTTEEREQLTEGFRKELAGLQTKVDQGAARVAELEQLAQLRAEEVLGRGKELLEFGECTEALIRQLWPGEEAERILESDVCGETRAMFARIAERVEHVTRWQAAAVPVDHAAETLAQLEATLGMPDSRRPAVNTAGERWGAVAGRVLFLVELEHDQHRRETETVAALGRLQDALSDLQKVTRAQELDQDEANTRALLRRGSAPINALEAFLQRHTGKAEQEAEPLRSAQLGLVQELAALMVRHTAPAAAGLLGGTALVDEQLEAMREEPLNPGEVPECGAVCPGNPAVRCTRPRGHASNHEAWCDEGAVLEPLFNGRVHRLAAVWKTVEG